jgi:hypothetical protein
VYSDSAAEGKCSVDGVLLDLITGPRDGGAGSRIGPGVRPTGFGLQLYPVCSAGFRIATDAAGLG